MLGCVQVWLPIDHAGVAQRPHHVRRLLDVLGRSRRTWRARAATRSSASTCARVRAGAVVERQRHAALAVRAARCAATVVPCSSQSGPSPCDLRRLRDGCAAGAPRAAGPALRALPPARASRVPIGALCRLPARRPPPNAATRPATMPAATSSTTATASSRRRAYVLIRLRAASCAPRRGATGAPLRGELEAGVDHHEAGELRAEHEAVGVTEARERAAARDRPARPRRSAGWRGALAAAQRAHDAAEQRDRAERVERDRDTGTRGR